MKSLFTKNKKVMITLFLSFFLIGGNVMAQPIAAWNFFGLEQSVETATTMAATTFDANLVSTGGANLITRGPGAPWSTGVNSFRTTGFRSDIGINTTNTNFFQITITASDGYKVSLSTIDARLMGTQTFVGEAGVSNQFAYSLDGTNFTLIGSPQVVTGTVSLAAPADLDQIDLTGIADLQNVEAGTTITIRFYASGQTNTGGWGFFSGPTASPADGLAIGGTVAPIGTVGLPERNVARVVYSTSGQVHFTAAAGEMVQIYNVLGQRVYQGIAIEGANSVAVSSGVALVRVGNTVNKVVVR